MSFHYPIEVKEAQGKPIQPSAALKNFDNLLEGLMLVCGIEGPHAMLLHMVNGCFAGGISLYVRCIFVITVSVKASVCSCEQCLHF